MSQEEKICEFLREHPDSTAVQVADGLKMIWAPYAPLFKLEKAGRVTSDWASGPVPRRRLYRLAEAWPPKQKDAK